VRWTRARTSSDCVSSSCVWRLVARACSSFRRACALESPSWVSSIFACSAATWSLSRAAWSRSPDWAPAGTLTPPATRMARASGSRRRRTTTVADPSKSGLHLLPLQAIVHARSDTKMTRNYTYVLVDVYVPFWHVGSGVLSSAGSCRVLGLRGISQGGEGQYASSFSRGGDCNRRFLRVAGGGIRQRPAGRT